MQVTIQANTVKKFRQQNKRRKEEKLQIMQYICLA